MFIKDRTRDYCQGYLDALRGSYPRENVRLVRSDGKVMDELQAYSEVAIGQVAGFPTPEQYEQAAQRALLRAAEIRQRSERDEERREARRHP